MDDGKSNEGIIKFTVEEERTLLVQIIEMVTHNLKILERRLIAPFDPNKTDLVNTIYLFETFNLSWKNIRLLYSALMLQDEMYLPPRLISLTKFEIMITTIHESNYTEMSLALASIIKQYIIDISSKPRTALLKIHATDVVTNFNSFYDEFREIADQNLSSNEE